MLDIPRLLNALHEYSAAWKANRKSAMIYWAYIVELALGHCPPEPENFPVCESLSC